MKKKFDKLSILIFVLVYVFCASGCLNLNGTSNSNIVTGSWNGDVFTNIWSNITFKLPADFDVMKSEELDAIPGHVNDFLLLHNDQKTSISLSYVDLSYGNDQELTEEEYLDTIKSQLANSSNKDYDFANEVESVVFAGDEYLKLHSEFTFKEFSTDGTNYQDGYVRKYDGAMILLIICYSHETKDATDLFLSELQ